MENFVPTRASTHTKGNYVSVNYEIPKRKTKSTDNLINKQKNDPIDSKRKQNPAELKKEQEKEMKKARYDVIKLGISGFEKTKARKTKVDLAVSLGAVPPKNRRMNYKKLKIHRKMDEERIKEKHITGLANSLLKPKLKKVSKKNSGILGVYGKVAKNSLPKRKS